MIRGLFRFLFRTLRFATRLAVVAGAAFAVFKVFQSRREPPPLAPSIADIKPRQPETMAVAPPKTSAVAPPEAVDPWVEPKGVSCPATHPIKAKLSSGIYHLPGMVAYERTAPDRCYADEDTAQADGLRKSKR